MARFVLRCCGTIMGSYPVSTDEAACAACEDEDDALNAYAKENGQETFKLLCKSSGLTRDDFKVEAVQ